MTIEFKDKDGNVTQTIKDEGILSRPGTQSPAVKLEVTASPCKHNWHFVGESSRLRCERCKQEVGPWTTEQLTVPADMHLSIGNIKPDYNISFHNNRDTGGLGKMVGKLDFNGPELVFTGDAAESAKVFIDWIAMAFKGRLEQERAEEREACAKVCDEADKSTHPADLADAIRARGQKP